LNQIAKSMTHFSVVENSVSLRSTLCRLLKRVRKALADPSAIGELQEKVVSVHFLSPAVVTLHPFVFVLLWDSVSAS
jgi:hypothetical protein